MDNVYSPRIAETDGVPIDSASYQQQQQKMPSKVAQTPTTMKANSSSLPPRPSSGANGDKTSPSNDDDGKKPEEQIDQILRQMFGSCGGIVSDAAVFLFQATCRGQDSKDDLGKQGMDQQHYLRMANRRRAYATPGGVRGRRQGETLEFPTQGGFDDDVSALSAHTLEEMERDNVIARAMKSKFPPTMSLGRVWGGNPRNGTVATTTPSPQNRHKGVFGANRNGFGGPSSEQLPIISPPATTAAASTPPAPASSLPWTYQVVGLARQTSEASQSIGVSTSGSSDGDQPDEHKAGTSPTRDEVSYTRVVV